MLRFVKILGVLVVTCALVSLFSGTSIAGTIIKLSLSAAPADIAFSGVTLSTVDATVPPTPGDQNTAIDYQGFLSGETDVLLPDASFSMSGLSASGAASVFGGFLVIQDFTGGTFELYDTAPGHALLLSGQLANSTLTGPIGPPATGALFTTSFALVTGGSLASQIDADTLTLSMNFSSINNGSGLKVTPVGGPAPYTLDPFLADAAINIAADPIVPEPVTSTLLLIGTALLGVAVRRRG